MGNFSRFFIFSFIVLVGISMSSCKLYRQNIMFQTDGSVVGDTLARAVEEAEGNYVIRANDYLDISVYTNGGERLIDPNFELSKDIGQSQRFREKPQYLVTNEGYVALPLLKKVEMVGLTLNQADSMLAARYKEFYEYPFVITKILNRRVFVLGANGGTVVPLVNENMNLLEVLAVYGGVGNNARAHNIRILRGDLNNPTVYVVDLSTIEGMRKADLKVRANDVIYVEPIRKPLTESIRDATPVLSIITSLITFTLLLTSLNSQ